MDEIYQQEPLSPTEHARKAAIARWSKPNPKMPPPQKPDLAKRAAMEAGKMKFIGSDCKLQHGGLRYSSTGHCVCCVGLHNEKRSCNFIDQ
ncbi:MAG TPA: hypothetical protein VIH42_02745 [Thermoguttaceae bacterium]